jgi:Rrf2 family iron-sulfur cluster assembly transcriptional regulator
MLTREADYALRTVDYLAHEAPGESVSARLLAEALDIPYRFERQILGRLRDAGLVESRRGGRGGVTLAVNPESLSLLDVVRAVGDRATSLNTCTCTPEQCERSGRCRVHPKLVSVQKQFVSLLASTPVLSQA